MEIYIRNNEPSSFSWLTYIKFIRYFNDTKFIRTLCKRGLEYCDDYKTIGNSWLEWEKKFGTIETIIDCENKIKKKMVKMLSEKIPEEEIIPEEEKATPTPYAKFKPTQESIKPPPLSARHTLFVKGIPEDTLEDELYQLFSSVIFGCIYRLVKSKLFHHGQSETTKAYAVELLILMLKRQIWLEVH